MKKLVLILNDLECAGKSTLAHAIRYYLKEQPVRHTLVTTNANDFDEDFTGEFWDLEDEMDVNQLIRALDANDVVLVDVHSGGARVWAEFYENHDLESILSELDADMTVVIPEFESERCHEEIVDLAEIFSDAADYVIARVNVEGSGAPSKPWKSSYASKATKYLGGLTIALPEVPDKLNTALESHDQELCRAIRRPEDLPRFLEVEMMMWLEKCAEKIGKASVYVLPEDVEVTRKRRARVA